MQNILGANPVWILISQSDFTSKLVLLILLFLSVASWAVLFYKLIIWRLRKKQLKDAMAYLKNAKNLEDVFYFASKFSTTLPGYVLNKELSFVKTLIITEKGSKHELDSREWELLQGRINQLIDSVIIKEESFLPVIQVSATVGPLLGLFGTVWGLVHAFIDISYKQSADIAVVAPGIAEALITTVAGLVVAIPALIMFNFLALKLRDLDQQISNLSGRFVWLVHKNFSKKED